MKTNDIIFNAFVNGDLINVLRGAGDYSIGLDQQVSANVPTDWTRVLPLFYKYANEVGLSQAKTMLEKAILDLLESNAEDLYIGMSVLYLQILREESDRSPFSINREKLLQTAANRIKECENELRKTKRWQGRYNPKGLLTEIERYQKLLKTKFGIDMRPQSCGTIPQIAVIRNTKIYTKASTNKVTARVGIRVASPHTLPTRKYGAAKYNLATVRCEKKSNRLLKHAKIKNAKKIVNDNSKKVNS